MFAFAEGLRLNSWTERLNIWYNCPMYFWIERSCVLYAAICVVALGILPPDQLMAGTPADRTSCASGTEEYSFLPWIGADACPLTLGAAPRAVPTGCPAFTVDLPREHGGLTIDAAEFGVSEALEDNTAALQRAIDRCRAVGAEKLVMKKGVYRFFGTRSVVFSNLVDFTFDAQGSTLVFRRASAWRTDELIWQATFHPEDANIFIRDCTRCRFMNYNMDWDWQTDPLATFARVTAVNPDDADATNSSVDFELTDYAEHPLYPRPMPIQCVAAMKETRDGFAPGTPSFPGVFYYDLCEGGYGRAMAWLAPNRIRLWPVRPPTDPGTRTRASDTARHEKKPSDPTLGRRKVAQYVVGRLYRIAHYYPGKSGIYMEGNRHLTLENANVYSCRGMAHVIDGPQHHTHFHHVHVVPPPGTKRPITATADACHVANSLGYLKLEDFRVTLNQDDPSNIHDRTSAGRRADARTIEITHERGNLYFGAKAGDEIEVRNPDFSPLGFRARIVAVDGDRLTMDRDVPESMREGSILFDRSRGTDHVWWKDCVLEDFWGRLTMMCSDLTFENCVFRGGTTCPLKVQAAFHPARWAEGAGATNHVYRGCTFEANQAYGVAPFGRIVSDIFVGSNVRTADYRADLTKRPWNGAVEGILFEKCRFVRPRGALAHLYSGSNLIFRDNEIVVGPADDSGHHPYRGSIFIDFADGVHVSGNRFTSEDPSLRPGVHVRRAGNDGAAGAAERIPVVDFSRLFAQAGAKGDDEGRLRRDSRHLFEEPGLRAEVLPHRLRRGGMEDGRPAGGAALQTLRGRTEEGTLP